MARNPKREPAYELPPISWTREIESSSKHT